MAAGESSRPLKPKLPQMHSEAAKAAAAAVQAHLDMEQAKFDSQMTLRRAQAKTQGSALSTQGRNIDMAMQARADAEAAGMEEPVGPQINVAPLPDGRNQSQTGGIDLNALLQQPGAIQGGAAIQQATGGMGRAQPSNVTPQTLQAQVSPYNVSQRITEGTRPSQIAPGMVMNQPVSERTTTIEPNTMTPAQLGTLLVAGDRNKIIEAKYRFESNEKVKDALATDLAGTYVGMQLGAVDPESIQAVFGSMAETLSSNGMTPRDMEDVKARALLRAGRLSGEEEAKWRNSAPELVKLQEARKRYHVGDPELNEISGRIDKLQRGEFDGLSKTVWDMFWKPTVVQAHKDMQRLTENKSMLDGLAGMVDTHPEMFGASGTLTRLAVQGTGALKSVASMFGGEEVLRGVIASGSDGLEKMREHQMANGTFTGDNITRYAELKKELETASSGSQLLGTVQTLENAFGLALAADNLDKTTVAGFDAFKNKFVNLTGVKDAEQVRAQLNVLQSIYSTKMDNAKTFWKYQGIDAPVYKPILGPLLTPGGAPVPKPFTSPNRPEGMPFFRPEDLK